MYILYIYKAITLKYNIAFHNCQAFFYTVEATIAVEVTITKSVR